MKLTSYLFLLLVCCSCSVLKGQTNSEIARVLWRNVTCEVHEQRPNPGDDELPTRELSFIDSHGNRTTAIQTPDTFLAMYPIGDQNAPFVTVWSGGSAYHVRVFVWKNDKPRCVLDDGSRTFPEIIFDVTQSGDTFFFLNDVPGGKDNMANWITKCYRWDGKGMVLVKKVPPNVRFGVLH